jgi:pimeloyl-ACP methyl ester carboxylesterase
MDLVGQVFARHHANDLALAMKELRGLKKIWSRYNGSIPSIPGSPVMIVPGYGSEDKTTRVLRETLEDKGAKPYGSGLKEPLTLEERHHEACMDTLSKIHETHGELVTLVGWSAGGLHVREMALRAPEKVKQVITLGSLVRLPEEKTGFPVESLCDLFRAVCGKDRVAAFENGSFSHLPVPSTSIFTRDDNFIPVTCALHHAGSPPRSENIEVTLNNNAFLPDAEAGHAAVAHPVAHLGLGMNIQVIAALCDRLANPSGAWKPFDKSAYPALRFA